MKRLFLTAVALVLAMPAAAEHGSKTLDEAWVKAITANDLEAVVALYADDATMYPPDQMEAKGKEAIRANYAALLGASTVKNAKMSDTRYETSGNFSMGWGRAMLTVVPKAGGDPQTLEVRFTSIAVKRGGKWLYLTDHASAPMPPQPAK
jgi:uncharacterized protein (TIGR02246 family)